MHSYDFEFVDKQWYEEDKYPVAVLLGNYKIPLMVNVKPIDHTK